MDFPTISSLEEISTSGQCLDPSDVEIKIDEGNILEAESSLREGLSLNYERKERRIPLGWALANCLNQEARALLGRLEYQRGNVEAALRVFDGIDLQAAIQRLQPLPSDKSPSKNSRSRTDPLHSISQHTASLVLEAIYLKSLSLQKLGRITEAAQECRSVLDAVEKIFHHGIPYFLVDNKLQEIVSRAVELLPELWKQAGLYQEVISSYRRALLSQWNLDNACCARIQKRFAVFLLYGGVEAGAPSLASQVEDSFVPKNNIEEAIFLLMILLRKCCLGKTEWDPSVMEHLTFALSVCNQTSVLARLFEEVLPGIYLRYDRWKTLALCYSGAGDPKTALNLLRKILIKNENSDDLLALLLASKICSEDFFLAAEGMEYSRRAIESSQEANEHHKGTALQFLGICLGRQSKVAISDLERSHLQAEALKLLDEAAAIEFQNPELLYELGIEYAEHCNMSAALQHAKKFIDATGGSLLKGWRLLALILSAQQRYLESEVVTDAALDETAKWEQGSLLRIKAKLRAAQSLPMDSVRVIMLFDAALDATAKWEQGSLLRIKAKLRAAHSLLMYSSETYRFLLALVQAQRKSFGSFKNDSQVDDDNISEFEFEVWHGLAKLYSSLYHWRDAEACLEKAMLLRPFSANLLTTKGALYEARGQTQDALSTYSDAALLDVGHIECKVSIGALLWKNGSKPLSIARCFLSDALRLEPTNRLAWYYLGMVHKDDGRLSDAVECFQAASMLDEAEPIERF